MKRISIFGTLLLIFNSVGCVSAYIGQGDKYFVSRDYVRALNKYEQALEETNRAQARMEIRDKIEKTKNHLVHKAIAEAGAEAESGIPDIITALENALEILKEAEQWSSDSKTLQSSISTYQNRLNDIIRRNREMEEQAYREISLYDFNAALVSVRTALKTDSENEDLLELQRIIELMIESHLKIQEAIDNNQIQDIIREAEHLNRISSIELDLVDHPQYDEILEMVRNNSNRLENEKRWFEAYNMLSSLNLREMTETLQRIRNRGSYYYYDRANTSIRTMNDYYLAYVLAAMAATLNDKHPAISLLLEQTEEVVRKSIEKYIVINTFEPPADNPDAGRRFSDSLTSHMHASLPFGIIILDLHSKYPFTGSTIKSSHPEINMIVSGSVSLLTVDTDIDERKATAKVKIGEESVVNPEFEQMLLMHGHKKRRWPSVPPMVSTREHMEIVNYSRGSAKSRAFATVSIRITRMDTGRILYIGNFEARAEHESYFQDEVEGAGIDYIPMQVPSTTGLKEKVLKKLVIEAARKIQTYFSGREEEFLRKALFHLERRETLSAIRYIARGYYFCLGDQSSFENQTCNEIRELMPMLAE